MMETLRAWILGLLALAVMIGAGALFIPATTWHKSDDRAKRIAADRERQAIRLKNGPYVARQKVIGPGETVKVLVVPGEYDIDMQCLVYTNDNYRTSSLTCPQDLDTGDTSEPAPDADGPSYEP